MLKFKIDGVEYRTDDHMRVGEICEAEQALNMSSDASSFSKVAVSLFVAVRRLDRDTPVGHIADAVLRADIMDFENGDEDESPPAQEPSDEDGQNEPGQGNPLISGPPLSAVSA